jgi:hypothetical protein
MAAVFASQQSRVVDESPLLRRERDPAQRVAEQGRAQASMLMRWSTANRAKAAIGVG